ncbi:PAS domain-containing protein [Edwardsiella anguillarum]|nr:PAS domain-containing protein [Edwardsiella anguillarum]
MRPPQAEAESLYFVAQMKEINDIKNNERQKQRLLDTLHQERERLHITLSAIGEAVISTDPQQIIRFMNPSAEKMTGWAQTRAIGRPLDRSLPCRTASAAPPSRCCALQTKRATARRTTASAWSAAADNATRYRAGSPNCATATAF